MHRLSVNRVRQLSSFALSIPSPCAENKGELPLEVFFMQTPQICAVAGCGFSTDELHADARAPPSGAAAQDTEGYFECLPAGPPDRLRAIASVQLPARPPSAFAGGHRPH